jgi:hypothetical protein
MWLWTTVALYIFGIINKLRLDEDSDNDGLSRATTTVLWPIEVLIILCTIIGCAAGVFGAAFGEWLWEKIHKRLIKWGWMKIPVENKYCGECRESTEHTKPGDKWVCSECVDIADVVDVPIPTQEIPTPPPTQDLQYPTPAETVETDEIE